MVADTQGAAAAGGTLAGGDAGSIDAGTSGRLAWRCRRGMKELDLVLEHWLRRHLPQASGGERAAFEALLDWPDPQLAHCVLGDAPPPGDDALAAVVAQLRAGPGRTESD